MCGLAAAESRFQISQYISRMALTEEKFKELMGMMLDKQNRDIEEKLGERLEGLKKEVSATMKTVTDRQDKVEIN